MSSGRQRHRIRTVGLGLVAVLLVEYVLLRSVPGVRSAWRSMGGGAPDLLGLGLCLEATSILSYSAITMAVLPRSTLHYPQALAIDVAGLGMSHVLPGGGATAAGLRMRLWTQRGVEAPAAVGATTVEYAVNVLWLIAALLVGGVVAAPGGSTLPAMRLALLVSIVLVLMVGGIIAVLVARPDWVVDFAQWAADRTPLLTREPLERITLTAVTHARAVVTNRDRRRRAFMWGLAYWGLDAASLVVCLAAFGPVRNPGGVLTTYALVNLVALLPLTPGGLGIVEGTALPALVSFGLAPSPALLGVLSWRLFAFWLPIPAGLLAYGWLRLRHRTTAPV